MQHEIQYFIQKANHCTRLARLIEDPVIKAELQILASEFMAEADRLAEAPGQLPGPLMGDTDVASRKPT